MPVELPQQPPRLALVVDLRRLGDLHRGGAFLSAGPRGLHRGVVVALHAVVACPRLGSGAAAAAVVGGVEGREQDKRKSRSNGANIRPTPADRRSPGQFGSSGLPGLMCTCIPPCLRIYILTEQMYVYCICLATCSVLACYSGKDLLPEPISLSLLLQPSSAYRGTASPAVIPDPGHGDQAGRSRRGQWPHGPERTWSKRSARQRERGAERNGAWQHAGETLRDPSKSPRNTRAMW